MYLPTLFEETDPAVLHALMRAHPLGTWLTAPPADAATPGASGFVLPEVNHLPFLLEADAPGGARLLAHLPRANPLWRGLAAAPQCLVVFQGPQHYISPGWYASKPAHGKVVPTWNYAVVHAYGQARVLEGAEPGARGAIGDTAAEGLQALRAQLDDITRTHEAGQPHPWSVADAPPDYTAGLMRALVCVEIRLTRLVGKFKLSQNRPAEDRQGVVDGLRAQGDDAARAMATMVAGAVRPAR